MSYIGNSPLNSFTADSTSTVTNKTVNLTNNTLSGTKAQFDTACSDGNFAYQSDIGVSIQGYDVDTAKLDVTQTFTAPQRGTFYNNSASVTFNLATANNFYTSISGSGEINFSGETAGQSGFIKFTQTGTGTVSAAADVKISSATLTALGATGVFILSYFCDGTNTYVVASGDLT